MPENKNSKQGKARIGDNVSMTGRIHVRGETHESEEDACEREAVETDRRKVHHTRVKGTTERGKGCGKPVKGKLRGKRSAEEGKRQSTRKAKQTGIPGGEGRKRTGKNGSKRKMKSKERSV